MSWASTLGVISSIWVAPQGQSPTGPGPGSRDLVVVVSISVVEGLSSSSVLVGVLVVSFDSISPSLWVDVGRDIWDGMYLASFTVRTTSGILQHFVPFLKGCKVGHRNLL